MFKNKSHLFFTPQLLICFLVLGRESLAMNRSDPQSEDTFWHQQTAQLDREHHLPIFPKDFFELDGKITFKMLKKILESPRHYNNIDKKDEWHFLDDDYIYKFESPTLDHSQQIETFYYCYFWKEQFWNYEKLRSSVFTFNNLHCYPYIIFDLDLEKKQLFLKKKHLFWIYRSNREKVNSHVGVLRCVKEFNINKISRAYHSPDLNIPKNNLYSLTEQLSFSFEKYNESLPPSPTPSLPSFKGNQLQAFSKEIRRSGPLKKIQKSPHFNPKSPSGSDRSKVSSADNPFESSRTTLTSIPDSGNEPLSSPPRSAKEKRCPPPIFSTGNDTPRSRKLKRIQKSRTLSPDNPIDSGSPTDSSNESPKISPTSMPDSDSEGHQKESLKSNTSIKMPTSPHGTATHISGPPASERTETPQMRRSRGVSPNLNKSPKKSSNPHFHGSREVSPNRLNQSLPVHYLSPYSEGDRELSPQKERHSQSLPAKPEICPSETSQETSTIISISKDDLANMKSLEFTISLQPGLNTIKFHVEDNSPNKMVPK